MTSQFQSNFNKCPNNQSFWINTIHGTTTVVERGLMTSHNIMVSPSYEGWNFNSGNYLITTDTK